MFKVSNNTQCFTIYRQWPLGFQQVIDFKENTVSLEDSYSRLYGGMYTVTWSDHKPYSYRHYEFLMIHTVSTL